MQLLYPTRNHNTGVEVEYRLDISRATNARHIEVYGIQSKKFSFRSLQHLVTPIDSSTAVEKVVACALVTQRARVRSPVGTSFLGEVFSGFFLSRTTNVGKL